MAGAAAPAETRWCGAQPHIHGHCLNDSGLMLICKETKPFQMCSGHNSSFFLTKSQPARPRDATRRATAPASDEVPSVQPLHSPREVCAYPLSLWSLLWSCAWFPTSPCGLESAVGCGETRMKRPFLQDGLTRAGGRSLHHHCPGRAYLANNQRFVQL